MNHGSTESSFYLKQVDALGEGEKEIPFSLYIGMEKYMLACAVLRDDEQTQSVDKSNRKFGLAQYYPA